VWCNGERIIENDPRVQRPAKQKELWHFEKYLLERKDVFKGHNLTVLVNTFLIRRFSVLMLLVGCLSGQDRESWTVGISQIRDPPHF